MILEALQVPLVAANIWMAADVVQCRMDSAPKLHVRPVAAPVRYDHSLSVERLTADGSDTISPYARHQQTLTQGKTETYIGVETKITFGGGTYQTLGLGCLWYDRIEVTIKLTPTIFMAKELQRNSCAYREVMKHERKHVQVDRDIVNKYAAKIGQALQHSVNNAGPRGPYPVERLEALQNDMQDYVMSVIKTQQSLMDEERFRKQQAVDTLEEYQRVQNACD